jgi:hypothetical protein
MLLGAGVLRLKGRLIPRKLNRVHQGISFNHNVTMNKGRKTSETIEIPFPSKVVFKLTRESFWDRFFKNIGFSEELQTRDQEFDAKVYISSDHVGFFSVLRTNAELRRLAKNLLTERVLWIACDGHFLTYSIRLNYDVTVVEEDAIALFHQLKEKLPELGRRFEDPFVWKALATQVFIWSVAGYALGGAIEYAVSRHDNHLFPEEVIKLGMWIGAGASLFAFLAIWALFRSSSRGHRILIESFLVLILTGPVASAQFVADINRGLDRSQPVEIKREVERGDVRTRRNRRSRTQHYYLIFSWDKSQQQGMALPLEMQVERSEFDRAVQAKEITLQVKRGFFGLPWYSSVGGIDNSPL